MRHPKLALSAGLLGLLLALGCGGPSEDEGATAAEVEKQAGEAVDAAADYATAQRRKLADEAERAAAEVERELSDARDELAELPGAARQQLESAIGRAERARETLAGELEELEQASAEGWTETRQRVSRALEELRQASRDVGAALAGEKPSEGS